MLTFATEFTVSTQLDRAAFIATVYAWLRGVDASTVLSKTVEKELDPENAFLSAPSGETLRFRELNEDSGFYAVGFQHDIPDDVGRRWRTEGVLRIGYANNGDNVLRLRTQCASVSPGATLEFPRKPYLIKAILKENLGGTDGRFAIVDTPFLLADNEDGQSAAESIVKGTATQWLPVIYISRTDENGCELSESEISRLAFQLGGVAHVVVEPSRAFSHQLRERCDGQNAYGGSIALSLPGRGIVRRLHLGWKLIDSGELSLATQKAALRLRSMMPVSGTDWSDLQERALRAQRERDRKRLTDAQIKELYEAEIDTLKTKIAELEQQISQRDDEALASDESNSTDDQLSLLLGPEIYPGESKDRLRLAAKITLETAEQRGLDKRSKAVLARFLERVPVSGSLRSLKEELVSATKDAGKVAKLLTALLKRHGYQEKSDNKHIRLEAQERFSGLDGITLPKTPSEYKGLTNLRKQIERTLGLTRLD